MNFKPVRESRESKARKMYYAEDGNLIELFLVNRRGSFLQGVLQRLVIGEGPMENQSGGTPTW